MKNLLRKFRRDEKGNILIITAAAMPMLIGMAGLTTDTIQWALWKRQLQRAADSAAIAGVYDRNAAGGETDGVPSAVARDLELNQHAGLLSGNPEIGYPPDTPNGAADRRYNQVSVYLHMQKALPFSSFFHITPTISVSATAASVPGAGEYCVIALDPTATTGGDIGGSTDVDLGKCCLIANSTHPNQAFKNTGDGSTVKAGCIAAAGGVQFSKSPNWQVDNYYPYSEPAVDPYANLPTPDQTNCTPGKTITISSKPGDYPIDRSTIDAKGEVVCITGGFAIKGALTLGHATYVINSPGDKDDLSMTEKDASLTCVGCTIIMTNFADRTKTANVSLTGGTVNVSAPTDTDEPYRGIVFYQDRMAYDDGGRGANHIRGNNTSGVQGVMYFPNRSLLYNGGGGIAQDKCMQIVAKRVDFSGNSKFKMGSLCDKEGLTGATGGGWLVRLVA